MAAKVRTGHIIVVAGGSQMGKTHWVYQLVKDDPRLLVWDVKGEYCRVLGLQGFSNRAALFAALQAAGKGPGHFAYVPRLCDADSFDWFCQVAFWWGHCRVVWEELADITHAGKAPPWCGVCIRRGADVGLQMVGVTQSPAESTKTVLRNATFYHCHRLKEVSDKESMARRMGVPIERIEILKPYEYLEAGDWIEPRNGKLSK